MKKALYALLLIPSLAWAHHNPPPSPPPVKHTSNYSGVNDGTATFLLSAVGDGVCISKAQKKWPDYNKNAIRLLCGIGTLTVNNMFSSPNNDASLAGIGAVTLISYKWSF